MDSKLKCVFVMPENSNSSNVSNWAASTANAASNATAENSKSDYHNSVSNAAPAKGLSGSGVSSSPKVIIGDCKDSVCLTLYGQKLSSPYAAISAMLDREGFSIDKVQNKR